MTAELKKIMQLCPNSQITMLSSLASGADTLCAQEALQLGLTLVCALPMPADEYRRDFSEDEAAAFCDLLQRANEVFVAPNTEPEPEKMSRDYHYRQAGIYVAAHSHVLLALWDGAPAASDGCGTAEAVDFMLKGSYNDGQACFRAENDGAVVRVMTPRASSGKELVISAELLENESGCLREVLRMTDAFNADAEKEPGRTKRCGSLLPDENLKSGGDGLNRLNTLYRTADGLSMYFQGKYMKAMKCFSIFGVLLVLSFLLYDELESDLFLLCYGLLIILYVLAYLCVRRGNCHIKCLQYRVLSETLRVQLYLTAAGTKENIGNAFTWTQKHESTWIKEAVSALLVYAPNRTGIPEDVIKRSWIDGQLEYHRKALKRDSGKHRINEATAKWMLICSLALFAAVLVLEFAFDSAMTRVILTKPLPGLLLHHSGQEFTLRSLLKIILGGVSAITVFLSSYYGKLSFERKSFDHEKMVLLFAAAQEQYENRQIRRDQLFRELAREEIIENGNWFSYCRENTPSFNV